MLNKLFKYLIYYPVTFVRREFFHTYLQYLLKSQYFSSDELQNIQTKKLNLLLEYCSKRVPAYAYLETKYSYSEKIEELLNLPCISKEDIRHSADLFVSTTIKKSKCVSKTSGGSTGAPITIFKQQEGVGQELAAAWRGYSWANVDVGDKQARFWGVPLTSSAKRKSKLIDFVCHRKRVSAFSFDDDSLREEVKKLQSFRPDYFYGYVSVINEFTNYLVSNNGLDIGLAPKCIITTSETLDDQSRKYFSSVYNCPVYNEYGCGEIGTIAHECEFGSLHINVENIILEIVDNDGNSLPAGSDGEIVVTDLNNYAMPLVRYKLKDFGRISTMKCECGRGLPILDCVYGRAYDIITNTAGKKFHGEFFLYIFEDIKRGLGISVDALQVEQLEPDFIECRLVTDERNIEKIAQELLKILRNKFDIDIRISVKSVNRIERENSGKLRVIKGLNST